MHHQHQQTYRPAPATSTAQAFIAAAVTLASFALIGVLLALGI